MNHRTWGTPPYKVAILHGGPGAPGEVAPVAKELSRDFGVLEPFQTKRSVDGQLAELCVQIRDTASLPVCLIGWSWGAWLAYLFTAAHPAFVKKLILVSSGPFEEQHVKEMKKTRLFRLSEDERTRLIELEQIIDGPPMENKDALFMEYGRLYDKADTYCRLLASEEDEISSVDFPEQAEIFKSVWREAALLRSSGKLLEIGRSIACPVTLIQGDYDARHVDDSLRQVIFDFTYVPIAQCGHHPWKERYGRKRFYEVLREIISQ